MTTFTSYYCSRTRRRRKDGGWEACYLGNLYTQIVAGDFLLTGNSSRHAALRIIVKALTVWRVTSQLSRDGADANDTLVP